MTAPAARAVLRLVFHRCPCRRCGGTGTYPSRTMQGKCNACRGRGRELTPAGRKAWGRYRDWTRHALVVAAGDVAVGEEVAARDGAGLRRVTAVRYVRTAVGPLVELACGAYVLRFPPAYALRRRPTDDELRAIASTLGTGATLTRAAASDADDT